MITLSNTLVYSLREITEKLLDSHQQSFQLRDEVLALAQILSQAAESLDSDRNSERQDIHSGETITQHGLAVSPQLAKLCAEDYMRTIAFLRGAHQAINDVLSTQSSATILYAGCGPWATLAIPIMSVMTSEKVRFTLLDIHQSSVQSVKNIIKTLGLNHHISAIHHTDALDYQIDKTNPPDIILLEVMQACLEKEPQVALSQHLLQQAPNALLIPEEIEISLNWVDLSKEFAVEQTGKDQTDRDSHRIAAGSVFRVNKEKLLNWPIKSSQLSAATLRFPDLTENYQPMLYTAITTYKKHQLLAHESGLTCPRLLVLDTEHSQPYSLSFHYQLGNQPKLTFTKLYNELEEG